MIFAIDIPYIVLFKANSKKEKKNKKRIDKGGIS
jgi:hypothetical protein